MEQSLNHQITQSPMFRNPPDSVIRELLSRKWSVAVVGCSPDPARDSHEIACWLIEKGHRVIPVNPNVAEILGRKCYPSLRALPGPVELVDIFRRSDHVAPIVDDAIAIGAKIVWMQLGVVDQAAAAKAVNAGLTVIVDRCPKIEYQRLFS